jgi:hypothetical protein
MTAAARGMRFTSPGPDLSAQLADELAAEDASGAMPFVNAQLVAHGFAHGAGLDTAGLDPAAVARLSKCLLGLLGQRSVRVSNSAREREWALSGLQEDMKRAEELTTKLRTMAYDHELLAGRHRDALDTAAHAEREAHVHKSRLSYAPAAPRTSSR